MRWPTECRQVLRSSSTWPARPGKRWICTAPSRARPVSQITACWRGGAKAGASIGVTDDFGFAAAEDRVHVHDLQATILHLLGLDHLKLTYRFQGRDFRLTDVRGEVVMKLLS